MPDLAERARALAQLHRDPRILVLANVWDAVSAQAVAAVEGVRALATASHSIAASAGYEDGENIPLAQHLDVVERIVAATDLPVSMDMESGYGDPGATARAAMAIGVAGGNLEDRLKPLEESVAAVEAVLAAGRDAGVEFVLNARTDAYVLGDPGGDPDGTLREAIRRGRAYLDAGAPLVFVPRAARVDHITALVDAFGPGRLSLIAIPGATPPVAELKRLGVARVSTGPHTQRVALTALQDATTTLLAGGSLPEGTRALN